MSTPVKLRPYQNDCLQRLDSFYAFNGKRALISVPTGGGKTLIFSSYASKKRLKTLVLAHREELLEQAVEKYKMIGGQGKTGFVRANGEWSIDSDFTAASIQTLYRARSSNDKRYESLLNAGYDFVVIDEAHHTMADTYYKVIKDLADTGALVLGVTATPFRSDDRHLLEFYEDLVYFIDIKELVRLGYLVPIKAKTVRLDVDMDGLKIDRKKGDFTISSIASLFNEENINYHIFKEWKENAGDRKTIFFLSSLDHSKALESLFRYHGVSCAHIDGSLPKSKRKYILEEFKAGRIRVLFNMDILTEGYDDPSVECIALVRPTKSLNLYTQIIGRGLRPSWATGKKDCLLLDFTGVSKRHKPVSLLDVFDIKVPGQKESFAIGARENERGERELKISFEEEEFDFVGKESLEFFTQINENTHVISCGLNNIFLIVEKNKYGLFDIEVIENKKGEAPNTLDTVQNIPEDYAFSVAIEKWMEHRDNFLVDYLKAKKEKPSDTQMHFLRKFEEVGLYTIPENLSKFDASNLLSYGFYRANIHGIEIEGPQKSSKETKTKSSAKGYVYEIDENYRVLSDMDFFEAVRHFVDGNLYITNKRIFVLFNEIKKHVQYGEPLPYVVKKDGMYHFGDFNYGKKFSQTDVMIRFHAFLHEYNKSVLRTLYDNDGIEGIERFCKKHGIGKEFVIRQILRR